MDASSPLKPPASLALDSLGIKHRLFSHGTAVHSLAEAASARNQRPEQVVRSILFQAPPGEFVMVLMAGPAQVDWKKLRDLVKRSRIRMATEDEVLKVTGYRVGTVSPFGLASRLNVVIDPSVLKEDEVSIGSGVRNTAIIMKSADLRRVLNDAKVISLAEESPS